MKQKILTIFLLIFIYFLINILSVSTLGNPVVEELDYFPNELLPLSKVRFNAGIYNNSTDIEEVRLIVQECKEGLCFIDSQNISMNNTYTCCLAFYRGEINLTHETATQVKYHFEIKSNGTWYEFEPNYISIKTSNEKKVNENLENVTPGFEYISIAVSFMCILFLKRYFKIII